MIQTNDNLRFIRLNTGEDIITELSFIEDKENKNTYYVLSNPLKIVYSLSKNSDQIGISLLPWVFDRLCATSQFVIFPTDVLTMTIPSDELKKYYVGEQLIFSGCRQIKDNNDYYKFDFNCFLIPLYGQIKKSLNFPEKVIMKNNQQKITDTTINAIACSTTFAIVQQTTRALLQIAYNKMTCQRENANNR